MINNAIARRYAKALVQLGSENGMIERFGEELAAAEKLFATSKELTATFANPAFTVQQKKQIMGELVGKLSCSVLMGNFLLLLVDKNRVTLIPQIAGIYSVLADELSGVIRPVITSAFPLSDSQVTAIRTALEQKGGKKVVLQVKTDRSLMGGIVTQIGDTAFDSSVRTQLARIHDILQKG